MRSLIGLALCVSVCFAQSAIAGEDFAKILDETWQFKLKEEPIYASRQGIGDYNHLLPNKSQPHMAQRYETRKAFLARLEKVDVDALSPQDKVNYELLKWVLAEKVKEYELGKYRMPINTFSNFYSQLIRVLSDTPLKTEEDYRDYIARINGVGTLFEQHIENMQQGIEDRFVLPKITVEGIMPVIKAYVRDDVNDEALYQKVTQYPAHFSSALKDELTMLAKEAFMSSFMPAFKHLDSFISGTYFKAARDTVGIYAVPNGEAYYQQQIKKYVTTNDYSAEQIHQLGLSEVARIRAEMEALIQQLEFKGSFDDFINFLRTDERFYAFTKEDLLKEAAYIAKRIDHAMPGFFGKLPRQPYGIEPVPDEIAPNYTTAAYWNSSIGADKGGTYVVNTYALDQRPLYELTALTLHEAVPGHHHQIALSYELDNVAPFRRSFYLSAFGEGWGLYSEKLGIEMGVYRTPYDHFGRLSYEMWRACRLVIDTGIHAKGWTRQQALDYLADNTSLSLANVRAEVDRYISWPAQALSYKMGELKILALRAKAEKTLGQDFDIKSFHDNVLKNGAVPLLMLEQQIEDYLSAHSNTQSSSQANTH